MVTTKPPTAERVTAAFRQLANSSKNLDDAVCEWKNHISALNAALSQLKIGVSAWHPIASNDPGSGEWWSREIVYAKVKDEWCIALRRIWAIISFQTTITKNDGDLKMYHGG